MVETISCATNGEGMMKFIGSFLRFWYHFIIGDDYRIALGVIIGFGGSAALVHREHVQLWWLIPVLIAVMLSLSLWLEVHRRRG
jgi:hypothetical protein